MPKKKMEPGLPAVEQRNTTMDVMIALTPDQLIHEGHELSKLDLEINADKDAARADATAWREKIKVKTERRDELAMIVETGKKKATVRCIQEANFERGVLITKNADTGEQISERALEAQERDAMAQGKLWGNDAELPKRKKNDVEEDGPRPAA